MPSTQEYITHKFNAPPIPSDMNKLPPIQGQSTLKQLEQIANTTVDQTNYAGYQSTVSAPPGQAKTQKKPRRRRKKKKPVEQPTESTLEVSDKLPTISAGQNNNQPVNEVPLPTAAPPPSEPYKPIDMNQLIREEQEKQRQINELLGSNVIPVTSLYSIIKLTFNKGQNYRRTTKARKNTNGKKFGGGASSGNSLYTG